MVTIFIGTIVSISSVYWLYIWVGLELNLIGFIPLIMFTKSIVEGESRVKYFVSQAIGSGLILFGRLISFRVSFSWDLGSRLDNVGIWLVAGGLFLKLGLFPFHYWIPSVIAGMSWFSCIVLATWQKIGPLFLLNSFIDLGNASVLFYVMCAGAIGSSVIGGVGGLNQTQLRALLAYSSINHLGWMSLRIMIGEWVFKIYLLRYIVISLPLFLVVWIRDFNSFFSLWKVRNSFFYYLFFLLMLLSLGGIPPLLGFFPKMIAIMIAAKLSWLIVISVIVVSSLLALFYYLSLFFSTYLCVSQDTRKGRISFGNLLMLSFAFMLNVVIALFLLKSNLFILVCASFSIKMELCCDVLS